LLCIEHGGCFNGWIFFVKPNVRKCISRSIPFRLRRSLARVHGDSATASRFRPAMQDSPNPPSLASGFRVPARNGGLNAFFRHRLLAAVLCYGAGAKVGEEIIQ